MAASIANEIIRNKKIALLERSSSITDRIKESFNKTVTTQSEIMELYSNVDMLIIDDFGSETITKWALERLYRIINNRYENELPIVITTRYTREELMEKIAIENRKLAEEFIGNGDVFLFLLCEHKTRKVVMSFFHVFLKTSFWV